MRKTPTEEDLNMYKDYRFINAGTNEFYRWGEKAMHKIEGALKPSADGFLSIQCDGGDYWTIGTSDGKFGPYAKFNDTFFSVNRGGFAWVKVGSAKEEAFKAMILRLLSDMRRKHLEENVDACDNDVDYADAQKELDDFNGFTEADIPGFIADYDQAEERAREARRKANKRRRVRQAEKKAAEKAKA